MPYTRAWSNLIPSGSITADTIEDHIRILREDIYERMNSLVVDWNADPVALKPSDATFALTDRKLRLPAGLMGIYGNVGDAGGLDFRTDGLVGAEGPLYQGHGRMDLVLPAGITIKSFNSSFLRTNSGAIFSWEFRRLLKGTSTYATLASYTAGVAQAGWQDVNTALTSNEVVNSDYSYFFIVELGGDSTWCLFHSLEMVYDSPSASVRI